MKLGIKIIISLSLLFLITNHVDAAYSPRGSIWGLAGSENQGRLDFLLPLFGNQDNLVYTDLQGAYAQDDGSYAGIGAGFRKLINNSSIYGGYLFLDRNESTLHNEFTVLSPGAEAIFPNWDFRLNGYFPVSQRSKTVEFFPSAEGDCRFVVFSGHQQFENRFSVLEQAGPGGDSEVGYTFHRLHNTQLHAGIYYFNFNHAANNSGYHNTKNITGIEGRLEIPVNPHWAVTVESSYDRYQHGTILGGLRFNFLDAQPSASVYDMHPHMVDPITRNVGSLNTGSGIPTVTNKKKEGLILQRDNIYFFTSQGGSSFVDKFQSGTFENPLRNDQFSQTVVNQIGNNANLYFNSGTYLIMGAGVLPNAQIDLPFGDSLYGRSLSFKCPASGSERPLLLGRINLLEGNNTIDSIQLLNNRVSDGTTDNDIIALNIQNAPHVLLSNDDVRAVTTITGDLNFVDNFASGIYANNSQVTIEASNISANATVLGNNNGVNAAAGIGANTRSGTLTFDNNNFIIKNSSVSGTAVINGNLNFIDFSTPIANFGSGIGSNTTSGDATFTNNHFTIINSNINGLAQVKGNNALVNFGIGIGGNHGNFFQTGDASFINNHITILNSNVSGKAEVNGNATITSFNYGIGFGGNSASFLINPQTEMSHYLDNINIVFSNISGTSAVDGTNEGTNLVAGMGANFGQFINNVIAIQNSNIEGIATIGGNNTGFNYAAGIGCNGSFLPPAGDFINNTIILTNSTITANATINGFNDLENLAIGIGCNNDTPGSSTFSGNNITINNSQINVRAIVSGDNSTTARNQAIGIHMNGLLGSNLVNINNQTNFNILSQVQGLNSGDNIAIGLIASGPGDVINIANSFVRVTASSNGTNTAIGHQEIGGGAINISNTPFVVFPP